MARLLAKTTPSGIQISFRSRSYRLKYPRKIWKHYPDKKLFMANYVPLATISLPLMLGLKKICYNTSKSPFQQKFQQLMLRDLPSSTYDNRQDAAKLAQKFEKIKYEFKGRLSKKLTRRTKNISKRAIIPLSLGKDSLLTLAVSRELDLNPAALYINDTVSPPENRAKLIFSRKLAKRLKLKHYVITNTIEQLNDFDTWNKPETNFNYSHMVTGFCFIALPFVHYHSSRYIILGNEQDMNFSFKTKQGKAWPAYDQTSKWQQEQNRMIKKLTANKARVTSLIRPLTNIAIVKILHKRYPKIAKYEVSCDCLDVSGEKRWCHACNKCARLFLFMKAFGVDTKKFGLRNLFGKRHKKLYCLFNGREVDRYEKSPEAREQQLLAFLLAYRNKERGYLIELFKKRFLKKALAQERELRKKHFGLWPARLPPKLKAKALSIYKEELEGL